MTKVLVLYYSMYGHTEVLVRGLAGLVDGSIDISPDPGAEVRGVFPVS
jgi:flavodoxin